ncbi:MAG: endonuclease MutS2, partial [Chloroflexota bacterium]
MFKTLEYDKVLEQLVSYTAFAPSAALSRALIPSTNLEVVRRTLAQTSEARLLLESQPNTSIGGARDIRAAIEGASRGIVLTAGELLDIKGTLISARTLDRQLENEKETYPLLAEEGMSFPGPLGLVDKITKTISDRGEILDSASPKLGKLRSETRVSHDRLLTRMQKLIRSKDITTHLQESLVTQRDGRYVIPIRAESKGRVKSVVHDVSASGATLFVEPLQVVALNNRWRELQIAEKEEARRVLAELSDDIGNHAAELQAAVETLSALDLIFARAKYAEKLRATVPQISRIAPDKENK